MMHSKEDLNKRIEEISESKRVLYVQTPEKKEGSWLEEFFINRVWDFIKRSFEFRADADFKDGHLYVDIFIAIAGRELFKRTIEVV